MSKELQALENIKSLFVGSPIDLSQQFDIIESALKDYDTQWQRAITYRKVIENNEDKIKALEIIKEKFEISKPIGIDIENNRVAFGCLIQKKDLTKEEFDLLKEILR